MRALPWVALLVVFAGLQASHGQDKPKRTLGGPATSSKQGLAGRDCLGCHKPFADKYMGMKNVHAVVQQNKCEECHLRHGLVARRAMKRVGNELCYTCHPQAKLGLSKPHIHTAVKSGQCVLCHNPHASNADHLLNAEGRQVCYQCHDEARQERQRLFIDLGGSLKHADQQTDHQTWRNDDAHHDDNEI